MATSTYYIDAVRHEYSASGTHTHISAVRTTAGIVWTRAQVIYAIRYQDVEFYTYHPNVPYARVIVDGCPRCATGDYITTEPDWTTANNLDELPTF